MINFRTEEKHIWKFQHHADTLKDV